MPQQTVERRKSQRKSIPNVCCWTISLGSFYTGRVGNLSNNGLYINTSKDVPVGSIVIIEFLPPDTDKVVCVKSKVIWSRADKNGNNLGIGVEFLSLSEKDKEVIGFYLDCIRKENDKRNP